MGRVLRGSLRQLLQSGHDRGRDVQGGVQQTLTVTASSIFYTNNMGCQQPNITTDIASGTDFYVYVVQVGGDATRALASATLRARLRL